MSVPHLAMALAASATGCASLFELQAVESQPTPAFETVVDEAASEIVTEGADLFWMTSTQIRTCALAQCVPITLVDNLVAARALAVAGPEVRYVMSDKVYRVGRTGGAVPTVLIDHTNLDSVIYDFVQAGSSMFYTENERVTRCDYNAVAMCGSDNAVADLISRDLVVDASGRLWGTGTDLAVHVLNASNAQVSFGLATATVPRALLAMPGTIFALLTGDDILGWPETTASAVEGTVAFHVTSPVALADGGTDVWVATAGGELWRRPLLGGIDSAVLVATAPAPPLSLVVAETQAIVALPDKIVSFSLAP